MLMTPKEASSKLKKKKKRKGESGESEDEATVRLLSEDPMDWMLQNEKVSNMLSDVRDRELPNRLISMVTEMNYKSGDADCFLLLLCKLKPFVWSMQKAIDERIAGDVKKREEKENILFRFVPTVEEFKNNGADCEENYSACKLF